MQTTALLPLGLYLPAARMVTHAVFPPLSSTSARSHARPAAATGGSSPSSGAQKRSPPQRKRPQKCPKGYATCPVYGMLYGAGYTRSFECVDIQNDLESCGGCVDGDSWNGEKNGSGGRDCSAIPNVDSVHCARGECVIGELHDDCGNVGAN